MATRLTHGRKPDPENRTIVALQGAYAVTGRSAEVLAQRKMIVPDAIPYSLTGYDIAANSPPAWESFGPVTFTYGVASNYDLPVSDADGDTLTLSSVGTALPTGVTLDSENARLVYDGGGSLGTTTDHQIDAEDNAGSVEITTFTLTSTSTQSSAPFMVAHPFAEGDVPSGSSLFLDEANARVVIKRRWNDGSVKHAIIVGRADLTADTPKTLTIFSGNDPGGTALTSASIQSAAPTASVQCGSIGTVSLASLLGSPFRTFISTPEMVECHYRSQVGSDTDLVVWFHVRLWSGGRMWVRAGVENGFVTTAPSTKTYAATVIIGGSTAYSSASLSHYAHSRWTAEGWIGGNPAVTPTHNVAYCISTKLVPNYWKRSPTATTLNALTQTYTPMQRGALPVDMSATGYAPGIGLLPNWDALYCTSADSRAWNAMLSASKAFGGYEIHRRSAATNTIAKPSTFPSTIIDGGTFELPNSFGNWDIAHLHNVGYAAYLFSGDYWHYEELAFNASVCYFCISTTNGTGTSKILSSQTRGNGWTLNVLGHFCAIAPNEDETTEDEAVVADYQTLFSNNVSHWATIANTAPNQIGSVYQYVMPSDWGPAGAVAPWMTNFWVMVNGHIAKMDPVSSLTNLNTMRDFMYKWIVGLCGDTGSANWHFSQAGSRYGLQINNDNNTSPSTYYQTWGECWTATFGSANSTTTNTLQGTGSADPAAAANAHRWATVLAAIAYAKEDSATGADAAWTRLTGASNWSSLETGTGTTNWNDIPIWGIVPRGLLGT